MTVQTGTTAVVVHTGGPTSVINASLVGVIEEARKHSAITHLLGARFGFDGVLNGEYFDLFKQKEEIIQAVATTPASVLGTSRREMAANDLDSVLNQLRLRNVRYLFVTGGNGSMETARQIQGLALERYRDLQVIGIPKTIDNDLLETHHTPGYSSAARFFACAARDIGADNKALPGQVEIIEVLGRNVGWLAAATSLARRDPDDAPHLIYFPERLLPLERLLEDIDLVFGRLNRCVVAVCEGQLDAHREPFGADVRPGSRSSLAMNLGHRLAMLVSQRLGIRARSEKPGLLGRSSGAFQSETDLQEARLCGRQAVLAAGLVPLDRVALKERLFPECWQNESGNDVTSGFRRFAEPLVGPIRSYEAFSLDA
jgi:ATP-dependent phosphofructokinase / diphosphate-dependent phosphofructokinase